MIQNLADNITKKFFEKNVNVSAYEVHRYGMKAIISTIVDIILVIGTGYIANHLIESILYFGIFGSIRKFSGGYHCDTHFKCITLHLTIFIIYILTENYYMILSIPIYIFSILVFVLLSLIKNRKLDEEQYQKYKFISLCILMVMIMLANITDYSKIINYVLFIVSILMVICIKKT